MPDVTWSTVATVVSLLTGVGGLILGVLVLRLKAEFPSRDDHATLSAGVKALAQRVETVERGQAEMRTQLAQTPTHDDLSDLRDRIADVRALTAGIAAGVEGLRGQLAMLLQHQLEKVP